MTKEEIQAAIEEAVKESYELGRKEERRIIIGALSASMETLPREHHLRSGFEYSVALLKTIG